MSGPYLGECRILENIRVAKDTYLMRLAAPEIARTAAPGQFVMVQCGTSAGGGPLLKRPFSIHRIGPDDEINLLYRVVGPGTDLLAEKEPGRAIELLGPLGRGFRIPASPGPVYLVGGGVGLAPLLALAEAMPAGSDAVLFYGERSAEYLVEKRIFERFKGEKVITTDDGSSGRPGLAVEPLAEALVRQPAPVFACGPKPMLRAVADLVAKAGVPAQVSLEAYMACGMGACLGCVVEVAKPVGGDSLDDFFDNENDTRKSYARVCAEGPVFDSRKIVW